LMESPVPFVFRVEKSICDEIDRYCAETGEYRSRAEFGRAAFAEFLDYVRRVRLPILQERRRMLEASLDKEFRKV